MPLHRMLQGWQLLALHTGYEQAVPYPLQREDHELAHPAPKLKRSKEEPSAIAIDDITTLRGVPNEAWDYVLGTRSALEWVLDQYKEKKDDLPPIDGLQPYRFSEHKEDAIVLLRRVCTVSCETMRCCKEIDCLTQPSSIGSCSAVAEREKVVKFVKGAYLGRRRNCLAQQLIYKASHGQHGEKFVEKDLGELVEKALGALVEKALGGLVERVQSACRNRAIGGGCKSFLPPLHRERMV